jgi:hypothetical protein
MAQEERRGPSYATGKAALQAGWSHGHRDVSGGWLRPTVFGAVGGLVTNASLISGLGGGGASAHTTSRLRHDHESRDQDIARQALPRVTEKRARVAATRSLKPSLRGCQRHVTLCPALMPPGVLGTEAARGSHITRGGPPHVIARG